METVLGKNLPPGVPVGESWEAVDRADVQSVVHDGPLKGATMHALWTEYREMVFGRDYLSHPSPRFPLLLKILDARDRLSVQVHPPAKMAAALGGEPKTEMWYFFNCMPGACVFAGLKRGVTRQTFESALQSGDLESVLHRIPVMSGNSLFIPSGRLHAIGEGCLLVEIQQNSDTTYRVFDWNRPGLDGQPRTLHIEESLASIDFEDCEPRLAVERGGVLADCEYFRLESWKMEASRPAIPEGRFALFAVVSGRIRCEGHSFQAGDCFLVPACLAGVEIAPSESESCVLRSTLPPL